MNLSVKDFGHVHSTTDVKIKCKLIVKSQTKYGTNFQMFSLAALVVSTEMVKVKTSRMDKHRPHCVKERG